MRLSELDYDLPEELIAQEPLARRDEARLLVLDRKSKTVEHSRFYKLVRHLRAGDLVVINDTRVLPARLFAQKESGGRVELLLVRPLDGPLEGRVEVPAGAWVALARTHRALKENSRLILSDGHALRVVGYSKPGRPIVVSDDDVSIEQILERDGTLALPHYIHRTVASADSEDYQTVYASRLGSIAAPTAGLHFTQALETALRERGIEIHRVTLHVGAGTFLPVKADDTGAHKMHAEWGAISRTTADALNGARAKGGRIVAVGTTALRLLESATAEDGMIEPFTGETAIFITPGYRFRAVDILLTNFHLPRSTLFMLVSAFSGLDIMKRAYGHAISRGYRFYSYGDACLLFRDKPTR